MFLKEYRDSDEAIARQVDTFAVKILMLSCLGVRRQKTQHDGFFGDFFFCLDDLDQQDDQPDEGIAVGEDSDNHSKGSRMNLAESGIAGTSPRLKDCRGLIHASSLDLPVETPRLPLRAGTGLCCRCPGAGGIPGSRTLRNLRPGSRCRANPGSAGSAHELHNREPRYEPSGILRRTGMF